MNQLGRSAAVAALAALVSCSGGQPEALGTLEWDRINGRAVSSEPIVEVLAQEGDRVSKGQPILRLDTRLQEARVAQLKASVSKAGWSLAQLEAGYRPEEIASARAELEGAVQNRESMQIDFDRKAKFSEPGAVSEQDIERSKNALAQAEAREAAAAEQLRMLESGYREEEIGQARAALEAAEAELSHARAQLSLYTVVAERDGVLDSLPFRLGDKPPAGAVVSVVLAGERPWARVYLPQPWLTRTSVGQTVQILADGLGAPLAGRVRHIESSPSFTPYYTLSESDRSRLSYVTEIDLTDDRALDIPLGTPVRLELRDE